MNDIPPDKRDDWHTQGIAFDDETYQILERESKKQDRSFSWLVRLAISKVWGKKKPKRKKL